MTVLIATANQGFFETFDPKLKFELSSTNTCTFKISSAKFEKLRTHIREQKLNPYALMYW